MNTNQNTFVFSLGERKKTVYKSNTDAQDNSIQRARYHAIPCTCIEHIYIITDNTTLARTTVATHLPVGSQRIGWEPLT
jgi:hypothetical protein